MEKGAVNDDGVGVRGLEVMADVAERVLGFRVREEVEEEDAHNKEDDETGIPAADDIEVDDFDNVEAD